MDEKPKTNIGRRWIVLALLGIAIGIGGMWFWQKARQPEVASISLPEVPSLPAGAKQILPIEIDTAGQTINAAEVYINFDPAIIQVESVSTEGSVFTIQIKDQPAFSNERGQISFAGGLPTPGFKGKGKIGTVTIIGKRSGQTELNFDHRTQMLLNDGLGTAVPLRLDPVKIGIK